MTRGTVQEGFEGGAVRTPRPLTIVMYHSVGSWSDPYTTTPEAFARQIRFIARNYDVLPLSRVGELLRSRNRPLRRGVVITFDDAFLDFYETAYPILARFGLPSTVFVPSGFIGGYNAWDADSGACARKPLMSEQQLRDLYETGQVELGSHTIDHVRMADLSVEEMRRQAVESRMALEAISGAPIRMFAYPYGQLSDFSRVTGRVLSESGYSLAVTGVWGAWNSEKDRLRLRRIFFEPDDSERTLRRKIDGGYDWIALKQRVGFAIRSFAGRAGLRGP